MNLKSYVSIFLFTLILAIPFFINLDASPIQRWDEARLAESALEMSHNKNWIVTMFDGKPDMWSTKPPLMIWLQVATIKLIGINELAVRLPSALAALGACLLIFYFLKRKINAPVTGAAAALVLATSSGYLRAHGTRTGEYDSVLTLLMLAYTVAYFLYLDEAKRRFLYLSVLCLILAALTKGIQSLLFLPALMVFTIYKKKTLFVLRQKDMYIGIGAFIFFVIGYYLLREHYNPGYIASVRANELGGRYNNTLEDHSEDAWWYFYLLTDNFFNYWYVLVIPGIAFGLANKNKVVNDITVLSSLIVLSYLLIISNAMTKLYWYMMPMYPFLAIVTGIFIGGVGELLFASGAWKQHLKLNVLPIAFLIVVFTFPYQATVRNVSNEHFEPWMTPDRVEMKQFLKDVLHHEHNIDGCSIIFEEYCQDLLWYWKIFELQDRPIRMIEKKDIAPGGRVVAYIDQTKQFLEDHYYYRIEQTFGHVTVYKLYGRKD